MVQVAFQDTCFLCGNKTWRILYDAKDRQFPIQGTFHVAQCVSCGMVATQPKPTKLQLAKHYPNNGYYTHFNKKEINIIFKIRKFLIIHSTKRTPIGHILRWLFPLPAIPNFQKDANIIDIGCGDGQTLEVLRDLGWSVYGLDIDGRAVRNAKLRGLTHVSKGSFEEISKFPDNYFDTIRMYHVIEHLDKPDLCLKLCYKKLKKGGSLLIGTPNINSLIARIGKTYWFNLDVPRHVYLFTPRTLRQLLEQNKFTLIGIEYGSGGAVLGTVQYFISEKLHKRIYLIGYHWFMILLYPIDWILDRLQVGDVFTAIATK